MRLLILATLALTAGCSLTPAQRFGVVAAVLVTGAIAAHQHDHGERPNVQTPSVDCARNPELCR